MATLAEIRAKLKAQDNRFVGDNAIYPHWNIPEGATCVIRFLPDADEDNTFFWVERLMIKLPFKQIDTGNEIIDRRVTVNVPCMEMWKGEICPVLSEVRPWFKNPDLEDMGRAYWKKRSYLFQGFLNQNPLTEDSPDNPIRRFIIGPQIFNIAKSALVDPEMEDLPTDYESGVDFHICKTSKGSGNASYADYSTSKWSRKTTPLSAAQAAAIEEFGLFNLADFLPKKPGTVELAVISEMFEASVDGDKPYDLAKFGDYYKPSGIDLSGFRGNTKIKESVAAAAAVADESVVAVADVESVAAENPVVVETTVASDVGETGEKAADILARIRNRKKPV